MKQPGFPLSVVHTATRFGRPHTERRLQRMTLDRQAIGSAFSTEERSPSDLLGRRPPATRVRRGGP
jgi:hypothetical protein